MKNTLLAQALDDATRKKLDSLKGQLSEADKVKQQENKELAQKLLPTLPKLAQKVVKLYDLPTLEKIDVTYDPEKILAKQKDGDKVASLRHYEGACYSALESYLEGLYLSASETPEDREKLISAELVVFILKSYIEMQACLARADAYEEKKQSRNSVREIAKTEEIRTRLESLPLSGDDKKVLLETFAPVYLNALHQRIDREGKNAQFSAQKHLKYVQSKGKKITDEAEQKAFDKKLERVQNRVNKLDKRLEGLKAHIDNTLRSTKEDLDTVGKAGEACQSYFALRARLMPQAFGRKPLPPKETSVEAPKAESADKTKAVNTATDAQA